MGRSTISPCEDEGAEIDQTINFSNKGTPIGDATVDVPGWSDTHTLTDNPN